MGGVGEVDRVARRRDPAREPDALREVTEWSARVGREWDARLEKLAAVVSD